MGETTGEVSSVLRSSSSSSPVRFDDGEASVPDDGCGALGASESVSVSASVSVAGGDGSGCGRSVDCDRFLWTPSLMVAPPPLALGS